LAADLALQRPGIQNMVEMPMGINNAHHLQSMMRNTGQDAINVATGIDYRCLARLRISQEVTIGL
jgi:hypothetical protein